MYIFAFSVAIPEDSERMVFMSSTNIMHEHNFSVNAPVISNLNVVPDGDNYSVFWEASDLDGDELSYDVYYSVDNLDFRLLLMEYNSTSVDIPDSVFPQGDIRLKVQVYDGFHESSIISSSFISGNNIPMTFILYPGSDSFFTNGTELNFEGWAYDSESEINDYNWQSDIDGYLGDKDIISANLSLGTHNITLTASDGSLSSSDSISITVTEETRPDLSIESIEMITSNPEAGQNVTIKALIRNIITDVFFNYSLYDGDPFNGGILMGEDIAFAQANEQNLELDLLWEPITLGLHNLYFVISGARPDESDTGNNFMNKEFNISIDNYINTDIDWEVVFINRLGVYVGDTFNAGVGDPATDGYEFGVDLPQIGLPAGKYIQMRTLVDGYKLTKDYRSTSLPKIWEVKLLVEGIEEEDVVDETGNVTWNYIGVPSNIGLTLIDYGTDSSRTTAVETIDMRADADNQYIFSVSKEGPGTYRYVDFVAEGNWCEGADVNRDGSCDLADFAIMRGRYGDICFEPDWCDNADTNKDGVVDSVDLGIFESNFGLSCTGPAEPVAAPVPEIKQELKQGWNLFSPAAELDSLDMNIQLKDGWNLFGYSSEEPFKWSEAFVDNNGDVKSIEDAQLAGWLQSTVYYFDEEVQTYKFVPGDDEYLRANNGYWLYAVDNLTLILPDAGSFDGLSYDWTDATFDKDGEVKTISEAQSLGWLQSTIYYFDEDSQTYGFVPDDDEQVYPGRGYWLYSNEEISLVIG